MKRGSLHVHTTYCDGKNTIEENIKSAIEKGFSYIGFSGHSPVPDDLRYCMSFEGEKAYFEEVKLLKEKYKDFIKVLCGLERDAFSPDNGLKYDYILASAHYLKIGDKITDVDESSEIQKRDIEEYFGGDPYAYAEEYYKNVAKLRGDIIGHFDLLTKFDRNNDIFSPREERYKKAALSALEELLDNNQVLEVNTGAMARGYKNAPYPAMWLLEEIKKHDGRVVITSDCHRAENLDYGYDEAEKILSKLGFKDFYNIDFIRTK